MSFCLFMWWYASIECLQLHESLHIPVSFHFKFKSIYSAFHPKSIWFCSYIFHESFIFNSKAIRLPFKKHILILYGYIVHISWKFSFSIQKHIFSPPFKKHILILWLHTYFMKVFIFNSKAIRLPFKEHILILYGYIHSYFIKVFICKSKAYIQPSIQRAYSDLIWLHT